MEHFPPSATQASRAARVPRLAKAHHPIPRIVGLTGGVGMGKTTISDYLKQRYQLPILDADLLAREAVQPGSEVLTKLVERYGANLLLPSGQLNRLQLGDIVFKSTSERQWLEQQIHPYVRDRIEAELQALAAQGQTTAVLVVPLLFEARMTDLVTEIWVVYSAYPQQVERLKQRDRLNPDQIQARISSQMAIEKKLEQADVILDNASTLEALFQQIDRAIAAPIIRAVPHPTAEEG
jgi:dephospho-CoA kinase